MRWRGAGGAASVAMVVVAVSLLLTGCGPSGPTVTLTSGRGPSPRFDCRFDLDIDALSGADGTASAIGWEGNHQGVVTCLGGTFFVQDGIDRNFGFGIYGGSPTTWTDLDGYLPAQVTSFERDDARITITEFADRVLLGGRPYVAVYSRVAVHDDGADPVTLSPDPSAGMVELDHAVDTVRPGATVDHDYVVAVDRFGQSYPWPNPAALAGAGGFDDHLAHMRRFWDAQLAGIASITVPDRSLVDAYESGFISTQIARSGDQLDTGVNGYQAEFSHDVVGILANLFTQGDFTDAHALLLEARSVVGSQAQYEDGAWTYAWPWAIYLMKTGDVSFVERNFDTDGPGGAAEPSIEATAHDIAADRTGPGGIMGATDDIDTNGYWTVDDYEALTGLAAYAYIARRIGDLAQAQWATNEYGSLLAAVNGTLDATVARYGLDYLPCSMLEPNTADRCDDPEDANWAATFEFGHWAWEAPVFGAPVSGPGIDLVDSTYAYGFGRLAGLLPAGTFGGFPSDYYSSAYNAGYGMWGLAGQDYRDQGIVSYEFMIANTQSGPNSWWESAAAPSATTPWVGSHPSAGQGSSPHAWGMAEADQVLLDSLVTQRSDGSLVVGRGVPSQWVTPGRSMVVTNFPSVDGGRLGVKIATSGQGAPVVSLSIGGRLPPGPVLFELPSFVEDVVAVSAGAVDEVDGIVTLPPGTSQVTVTLGTPPP